MLLQNNNNDALEQFDKAVRECFSTSLAVDVSDGAWHQAQLGLRHGGLGLCSLSLHASYLNQPPMLLSGYQWFLLSNLVYTWNPMLSGGGWDWTHRGLQCTLSARVLVWTLWVIIVSLADTEEM